MTFKELKKIIAEQQKKLDVQSKTYNPDHFWNGKGLKEEHMQYKDSIVELLINMKDRIKVEDLTVY